MSTRMDLRNLCRRRLGDLAAPYHWSDLQVNQWINDAIADYGQSFPRQVTVEIATAADQQQYELPQDFQSAVSVEYPANEQPPEYLRRLAHTHVEFWELGGRYDVVRRGDGSAVDELWISDEPLDDEVIRVEYLADHASLDDDGDACTVPDRHLELLVLFVNWAALQELASSEARDPDPTTLAMSVLDTNAMRAERAYRTAVKEALRAAAESAVVSWGEGRVY
jgi:hypothetical protein